MKKRIKMNGLSLLAIILIILLAFGAQSALCYEGHSLPPKIPGNYKDKWYGVHCTQVPLEDYKGLRNGPAFPGQKIINSWGYKANPLEEIKSLIPPVYYDICSRPDLWGNIRINETAYIPLEQWPGAHQRLRREATEANRGKAGFDEKGHLINYTNGIPFPGSMDGREIAWNFVCSRNYGQDALVRFYTAVTDKKGHSRHSVAEQNYLWWKGRLHGELVPAINPNPNNYEYYQAMGFKAPYDLRGMVTMTHRYDDADKQDDQWMYITSLRRVRRMSAAQRWDKLPGGQDITYDSATGFQGKPTNYEWKFLGRKELLCGRQAISQLQEIKGKPGGGTADQLYQRVNTVMLEYTPKIVSSVSKAIMYLDPETYFCYYVEFYDRRGRPYLFYNHCWAITKDGCAHLIGFFVGDVQRTHSSNNYIYDTCQNLDAEKSGIGVSFFQIEALKKRYGGR